MPKLSMRQYAKHRGVTAQAVSMAVKAGRISCDRNERGYALIDPEIADREWAQNSDNSMFRNSGSENRISKIEESEELDEPEKKKSSYNHVSSVLKSYQARLAALEYNEKSGKLHDVEQCKREGFAVSRSIRDALLGVPDRLCAELAGESDQFKIRQRLEDEIRQALTSLADQIEKEHSA